MNNTSLYALVNFRYKKDLLESFDRVCLLSGKTRTQALSEMMRKFVSEAGPELASKVLAERALNERLKTAVERRSVVETIDPPRTWSSEVYRRLKPFSSPDFDPVR